MVKINNLNVIESIVLSVLTALWNMLEIFDRIESTLYSISIITKNRVLWRKIMSRELWSEHSKSGKQLSLVKRAMTQTSVFASRKLKSIWRTGLSAGNDNKMYVCNAINHSWKLMLTFWAGKICIFLKLCSAKSRSQLSPATGRKWNWSVPSY